MDIETLVKKHADSYLEPGGNILFTEAIRNALTEQAETHAIEQRACNKLAHDHGFLLAEREALQERIRQLEAERVPAQQYTTGHCANKAQPGGCKLHNLHCNYPICDRRPAAPAQEKDNRPANCRNRLSDEGKTYPRSGCAHCKTGGITGCPFKKENSNG